VRIAPAWWRARPALNRRQWGVLVATITGLTVLAALTVPYTYKVLYDEYVLQGTALNLHQTRDVGTTVRAFEFEGTFRAIGHYLDKRPFFYAFVLSLLHDLTGYREANAFALNTGLMPLILGLLYWVARRLVPHGAGLAAVISFGAFSLLAHNATGAGMEMLNLAMLLVTMLLAVFYLEKPDEPRLSALVLAAALLAQTRYESGLYVAPVALVVLEGWRRQSAVILSPAAVLVPALLIPYALHNTYLSGTPLLWELRDGAESRFALQFLPDNLWHAARFFFNFTTAIPNSWWLGVAGVPALVWAGWQTLKTLPRWRTISPTLAALLIFSAAIAVNLGLLMFYYWGQLDDPIVARLALPFCLLLALSLAWVAMQVPVAWQGRAVAIVAGGALISYATTGLRVNTTHWEINLLAREIAWEANVVDHMGPAKRLIITNKSPLPWVTREVPAVLIARARWRPEAVKFHLDHHTFDEALVTQIYRPTSADGGFQIDPEDRLPTSYVLEPVSERSFGTRIARISRVTEIRLDAVTLPPVSQPVP
ncbi:MAG: glycosyltransferase family 39 protein, partial [Candidatus Didemnitutus sp.]|nr:glycosyltransferase family 39 protein [Candidatus Didemnitutus sp.]